MITLRKPWARSAPDEFYEKRLRRIASRRFGDPDALEQLRSLPDAELRRELLMGTKTLAYLRRKA